MKKIILLGLILIFLFTLSCCNTTTENNTEITNNSETPLIHSTEKTGELKQICEKYYYAIIDSTSELQEYGLYYKDTAEPEKYFLIDNIGTIMPCFIEKEGTLYYTSENKVKSVFTDGSLNVTLYAPEIYSSEKSYSIEKIELIQDGKMYCKADRWGITEETKNDRETVYLSINTDNSGWQEITQNNIPANSTQYKDILSNIKTTLDADLENILVKSFRVKYTANGNIDSAIFSVWIYNSTKNNEKFGIEGNILIVSDGTAFFNKTTQESVLLPENNSIENDSLLSIDKIWDKVKLSVSQTLNTYNTPPFPEYFLLTFGEEKYVEYVASADSKASYLLESNKTFVSSSKPHDLTPQTHNVKDKMYFIVVPHYLKDDVPNFIFEEDENLVSCNYSVLLFNN